MLKNWLAVILAAIFLVACGGGDEDSALDQVSVAQAMQDPFKDVSRARSANTTLIGTPLEYARAMAVATQRKHALSATPPAAGTRLPTEDELFNWGQKLLSGLFPGNPPTMEAPYGGPVYKFRAYPAPNTRLGFTYLGVRQSDKAVFVLFSNGDIVQYGFLADYACDVLGCGGGGTPAVAGQIDIAIDRHTLVPGLFDGKIIGNSEGELDPSTLDRICVEGPSYGFDTSTTCGPFTGGRAIILGVSNNDRVQYVGRLKGSGKRVWFTIDPAATTHWTFAGLNAVFANGFVEYGEFVQAGQSVYRKPQVRVEGRNLVLAFGRNRLGGFGLDGRLTDFTSGNYQFRFQPRVGTVRTAATAVWDDVTKQFKVVMSDGLACSDTGTLTVHRQLVGGIYSTAPVGYLAIGRGTEAEPHNVSWDFIAPGVTPLVAPPFFGFSYRLTGSGC